MRTGLSKTATRKVKKQFDVEKNEDPSSKASDLYEKFKNMQVAEVETIDELKNTKE